MSSQHLLDHKCIGYVEYEKYCQKILRQRIRDGILDAAPIFGDIKMFISEGYAEAYKGMVDVLTAGFPCQPFSVAGKGAGENDPRNMWPQTQDCISIIRPQYCFLENVPGLLSHGYIRRIFGDLAAMGYNAKWGVIGADDVGAPHRRKRLWIVANSILQGSQKRSAQSGNVGQEYQTIERGRITWWDTDPADLPDTIKFDDDACRYGASADGGERHEKANISRSEGSGTTRPIKPRVGRVVTGCSSRVGKLKALGNMQVPAVAATAWKILTGENND